MANEVRERFKERKYSYKNKLMETKKKQIIKLAIITPLLAVFSFFKEDETNTTNKKVLPKDLVSSNNIDNDSSYLKNKNTNTVNKDKITNTISNNELEKKIYLKLEKELIRLKNECEIIESEEYIINKYEKDQEVYNNALRINKKIDKLLIKLKKIEKDYKLFKDKDLIKEPLFLEDTLLIDDIIEYRESLSKIKTSPINNKLKLLGEYQYLYLNLDKLIDKTEQIKEISNKRVEELSLRDQNYKEAKNKIVNISEIENCTSKIINKNKMYLEELSKKVDKITEEKYIEKKLEGMNGFFTSSLRYIFLLTLTPLSGIFPGIAARTIATRKLLHGMLENMHYKTQEKSLFLADNYLDEINNRIYDIKDLEDNIDSAIEEVQKLKKEFQDEFLAYNLPEYDKTYKKLELIEANILNNKEKTRIIKEKLIKNKTLNKNTLLKVRKLNTRN